MKKVFLFSGQGGQFPGMLQGFSKDSDAAEILQQAEDLLHRKTESIDSKEALQSNQNVQLSLFLYEAAALSILRAMIGKPDFTAGHSIGAFSAAFCAESLSFEDALSAVKFRGELMESAYPEGFGMGAVLGLGEQTVRKLTGETQEDDRPVYIANLNAPHQITVSGKIPDIQHFFKAAGMAGAYRTKLLDVSVPSHCPLMEDVSSALAEKLSKMTMQDAGIPYMSNSRARMVKKKEEIRRDLALSVSLPVRWHDGMSMIYERGFRLYIEIGPGEVLSRLMKDNFSDARSVSCGTSGVEDIEQWMRRLTV